jgi:hypothetical protein
LKKAIVVIGHRYYVKLMTHLFHGTTEQGAFLFVTEQDDNGNILLLVNDIYLVPEEGWDHRSWAYLELNEKEKVKIMLMAREKGCCLVECHSHRFPASKAVFSISDEKGLEEFLGYVKWKLGGKTYGAIVFGKSSMEGKVWPGATLPPVPISQITVMKSGIIRGAMAKTSKWSKRILCRGST